MTTEKTGFVEVKIIQIQPSNEITIDAHGDAHTVYKYELRLFCDKVEKLKWKCFARTPRQARRRAKKMISSYINQLERTNFKEEVIEVIS